jgi:hypothetical protein
MQNLTESSRRRAQAMVVVTVALALLVTTAVSFAAMTMLEAKATANCHLHMHAAMAKNAGIERATAELYQCFRSDRWYGTVQGSNTLLPLWFYGGEDINGNGRRDIGEADLDGDDTMDCPLDMALSPSFRLGYYGATSPARLDGLAYSGKLPVTGMDVSYVLRSEDLSARLAIEGGIQVPYASDDTVTGVRRMLHTLAYLAGKGDKAAVIQKMNLGLSRYSQETAGQFMLVNALHDMPEISRHLTAYAWKDHSTIKPPVLPIQTLQPDSNRLLSPIRYREIAMEARAPININTASWEVLVCALHGLKARAVKPGFMSLEAIAMAMVRGYFQNYGSASELAQYDATVVASDSIVYTAIDLPTAMQVSSAIIERRQREPFTSWRDLARFLAALIDDSLIYRENDRVTLPDDFALTPQQASLIWANANPNTDLNKHNPDFPDQYLYQLWTVKGNPKKSLFYRIDKSDLIVYTSEFCFYPTGYFAITSLGRAVAGDTVSEDTASTVVKIFDIHYMSTQADFDWNLEAQQRSQVASHPEPNKAVAQQCEYDGAISIAPYAFADPDDGGAQGDISFWRDGVEKTPLVGNEPGNRFPDGVFADQTHMPGDPRVGIYDSPLTTMIAFWYKPNWDLLNPWARPHAILEANTGTEIFQIYSESRAINPSLCADGQPRWSMMVWEKGDDASRDSYARFTIALPDGLAQNRWLFLAFYWNGDNFMVITQKDPLEEPPTHLVRGEDGELVVSDSQRPVRIKFPSQPIHLGGPVQYPITLYNRRTQKWDTRMVSVTCPSNGSYADLRMCQLVDSQAAEQKAREIYNKGRYQNINPSGEFVFLYAPLQLAVPLGCSEIHLGALRWTQYAAQDCTDFCLPDNSPRQETMKLLVTLYRDDGQEIQPAFNNPDSNKIDKKQEPFLRYRLEFKGKGDRPQPLFSAPMLDDLTITYSLGCKCMEFVTLTDTR